NTQRNPKLAAEQEQHPHEFALAYLRADEVISETMGPTELRQPARSRAIERLTAEAEQLIKSTEPGDRLAGQIIHEQLREAQFTKISGDRSMAALGGKEHVEGWTIRKNERVVERSV